ncbi:MAG: hypothetical protein WCG27_12220, partial [Pseudomonadota bacterium]
GCLVRSSFGRLDPEILTSAFLPLNVLLPYPKKRNPAVGKHGGGPDGPMLAANLSNERIIYCFGVGPWGCEGKRFPAHR